MLPSTQVRRRSAKSSGGRSATFALGLSVALLGLAAWAVIGSWGQQDDEGWRLEERRPVQGDTPEVQDQPPGPSPRPAAPPVVTTVPATATPAVARARETGDPLALRRALGDLLIGDQGTPTQRQAWRDELDGLNRRWVFSDAEHEGFGFETVQRGDSYWKIVQRIRKGGGPSVGDGLLSWINGVPAMKLRPGMRLKVPTGELSLLIKKSEFRLYVLLGGIPVHHWPVGTGRDDRTPEGSFTISGKTPRPTWTDPESGKVYRYGEPGHLIGSRWLGFAKDGVPTSYGIHGTVEPESIGKAQSAGCLRMREADVEALFDVVPEGTPVRIVP